MNGKIVLCFAVVFIGQTMSAATGTTVDPEDFKRMADQMTQTLLSIGSHVTSMSPNSADVQKNIDKFKAMWTKGISEMEVEAGKMRETVRKNSDPKMVEKVDELEKEIKKQMSAVKDMIDDKIVKPVGEKLGEKLELKKITDHIIKTTKEMEASVNKAIDGFKKQ